MFRFRLFVPATVLLLVASFPLLHAYESDFEVEQHSIFKIKEGREGKYSLESEVKVWQTYLTDRSTSRTDFPIPEPFYGKVDDLSGKFSGGRLGRDNFSYVFVEHEDIFISNNKVHWIHFPDKIKAGETVQYGYSIKYENAAWFPVQYVTNNARVRKHLLQIEHPADVRVDFSFFFPRDSVAYRIERPSDEKTLLIFENVEETDGIPYFPFNSYSAAVQVRLSKGGIGITPTTPKEFTDWYRALFEQTPAVSAAHSAKVRELLAGKTTDREKLAALHDYVREHIRYIADEADYGAIVPREPNLVMDRGYGDCKDRAFLIAALARDQGIKVNMALVSTQPTAVFDNGVYVSEFNHAICAWRDGSQIVFFDPTGKYTDFGNLPQSSVESVSLVLDPENPTLVTIPRPNEDVAIELDIQGSLDDPENAHARVTLRNSYMAAALQGLQELQGVDLENLLSNMLTGHFHKLSLDYFELDTVQDGLVTFTAQADMSDFLISSTTKKYVPGMPFRTVDAEILEREKDSYGIWTGLQETIRVNMRLDIGDYAIEPKELSVGDAGSALFLSSISVAEDGAALVSYQLSQKSSIMSAESKTKYLDFCKNLLKNKKSMFVLTAK